MPEGSCDHMAVRCQLCVPDRMAVSCQLYSPGGSVRCLQMPRGVFLRSYGSQVPALVPLGGLVKVFVDARGGSFYDRTAVRCQLLFLWRVVRVFADARGAVSYNGS
jgi:hypothetical protein